SGSPMCITSIFQSVDNAKTWTYLCDLMPCEWSYMFTIENRLYMFGLSREYGDILISESKDEGKTWLNPTVIERGLGSGSSGFHRAPCKHLIHNGRIWLTVENGSWSDNGFAQCLISASIDDDLLDSNSWTITEPALFKNSLIEGTPFVGDDQNMYVMYRCGINRGYILKANASRPQDKLELSSVINIPFGHSKFELIKNSDGIFYAIGNEAINNKGTRHVLSLYKSSNCKEWEKVKTLIDYSNLDEELCGFQYPSCIIVNNKLTIMTRTSYNGAHTFHDSNMMLIYKFEI
ncbi:MAG: exo-alpha-sialidase, partial [Clostridia bacterium]|nr:exo-alpha-sialidase [Clostridia bacterium]